MNSSNAERERKFLAFFSYARTDSEFALKLARDLKAAGASVWLDQLDIPPGQRWDRAVEDALGHCEQVLVVLSPTARGFYQCDGRGFIRP